METWGCFLPPGKLPWGPSFLACGHAVRSEEMVPHLSQAWRLWICKGESPSAWSVTECVEFWNKMTFHSNLVVSGMFINKGTSLSAFTLVHHLHADIILHHTSAWGLTCPLLIHLLSLCSSGHSALCSLSRGSNQLGAAASWLLAAFTPVTRWCVIVALSLPSSLR